MTTRLRIDAVQLTTTEGRVRYSFPADLTVLAGPTGVGKTTLLELIKYGFGGNGKLAPVAKDSVEVVVLDVTIGPNSYQLARSLDRDKRAVVRVTDLISQERLSDHHVDHTVEPSLNSLLMKALELPTDVRAAARTGASSNRGPLVTFRDIFSFLYVAQADINRDIANSQEGYQDPKRRTVFELLFGLTTERIQSLRSRVNELNGKITAAEREHRAVHTFLEDTKTTGRLQAEEELTKAQAQQHQAEAQLEILRTAVDPVTDRETQALRDLLTEAEHASAVARAAAVELGRNHAEYLAERERIRGDIARLRRMQDAGERLANIEFVVCPRCMQSLTQRPVPDGACRVCLQHDPVESSGRADLYELRQLEDQLGEIDSQLTAIETQLTETTSAVRDREMLVVDLSKHLEERTTARITPRLQAFSDATNQVATAIAKQGELEATLRQWDRADDLGRVVDDLRKSQAQLRRDLNNFIADLQARRQSILEELSTEFSATVRQIGIPGVQEASIHPTNYLPVLNGAPYSAMSAGGGIITATQVAYWVSLLTVAIRRGDTFYPAFLLLDSPRLALNTAEPLTRALYSRIVNLSGAAPGRLQLIVADNEIPADYRADFPQIEFDYQHPTVSTITHPGRAGVNTIENDETLIADD